MKKHILPKGFLANGIHCGVKRKRKDLSVLFSEKPCKVAAVFTRNLVKAAPVVLAMEQLKKTENVRAIVVNSGNANCMTGSRGIKDAEATASFAAKALSVKKEEVLVSSTGIIGQLMDMKPILKGIPVLVKGMSRQGLNNAADGIMTTDMFRKTASRTFTIGKNRIRITGIAKGAGMIHPDMATMLCYIMTDADISGKALKKALDTATGVSFNAITVDGDMSTNDTVMLLANAEAGNKRIGESGKAFDMFLGKLKEVSLELAKMVVQDGEGASKMIEVHVTGASGVPDARKVAGSIAGSLLVKCAVLGGDPNWGRIASSAGASGVFFDPEKIEITLDGVKFFKKGKAVKNVDRKSSRVFKGENVKIKVDLASGKEEAKAYTCDVSKKYITLNSYYTT